MQITLEVPDSFNACGITVIYDAYIGFGGCKMYSKTVLREDVSDGKVANTVPNENA